MNFYNWSGINLQGIKINGSITADSRKLAQQQLLQQSILNLRVYRNFFLNKISPRDNTLLYRQLATIISAGVPLLQGLTLLIDTQQNKTLRQILQIVSSDIASGLNLSTALARHPNYFDTLTCHLIQISEHTGNLDSMLQHIASLKEKSLHLKNKIKQALFYPAIICVVALLVSLTMLLFVVPQFEVVFQSFHKELPLFTRQVIALSKFLRADYWLAFMPLTLAILTLSFYQTSPTTKLFIDKIILKIPITGPLVKKINLARFCRGFATLAFAGVPINDTLKMLAGTTSNEVFKNAVTALQQQILSGQSVHATLQQNPLFAGLLTQMVKVGEESGSLEQMLEKTATIYEAEMDYWIANFSQLLEPLIIIMLGVLIGGLVIAMYLPIFKLGTVL